MWEFREGKIWSRAVALEKKQASTDVAMARRLMGVTRQTSGAVFRRVYCRGQRGLVSGRMGWEGMVIGVKRCCS